MYLFFENVKNLFIKLIGLTGDIGLCIFPTSFKSQFWQYYYKNTYFKFLNLLE